MRSDPIDDDPAFKDVLDAAEGKAKAELVVDGISPGFGYRHALWAAKKEILKQEYGIDWHTPSELNPGVMFD